MDNQPVTRVALFHNNHQHHNRVMDLVHSLADEAVDIDLRHCTRTMPERLANCDLILFEAFGQVSLEQQAALNSIRTSSLAPIVMLISGVRTERTIDGILAGADAVISLNTANDVIVAHCQALIRRWHAQVYCTRKVA
jgi:DNA-binding response OmpR family regulator